MLPRARRALAVGLVTACALLAGGCCQLALFPFGASCRTARLVADSVTPNPALVGSPTTIKVTIVGSSVVSIQRQVYFDFNEDDEPDEDVGPSAPQVTTVEVEHTFDAPGTYRVRFTTITELKDTTVRALGEVQIRVVPAEGGGAAPVASFAAPASASSGRPVTFDASASIDPDGGRIVSYVYGVSTVGNVLGTLVTTFTLMPLYGSRALTMVFAGVTIACGLLMIAADRYLRGDEGGRAA